VTAIPITVTAHRYQYVEEILKKREREREGGGEEG